MQFALRQILPRDFPPLLTEIADPPARLFVRGTFPSPEYTYLCVVGSRAATPYSRRMCASLIAGLAPYKVAIVSGLALGIDAEAHKAALDVGLPTVAVLPSGLGDTAIYPSSNRVLAGQILKRGGALISENAPDFKPMLHSFSQRNRIMAGMSQAILVLQAGEKSGTLITARLALDYNREVLAIPHELGQERSLGTNTLLRQGATLVRNSADILEALNIRTLDTPPEQQTFPTDLSPSEIALLTALTEALVRDELVERTELSAQDAQVALSSLLIRGLITERLGKFERALGW